MNGQSRRVLLSGRLRDQRGLTLVELLVGMIVMGILTTMLLLTWFSLNDSYSYSVRSYEARDNARLAVSRLQREIRDAQGPLGTDTSALVKAEPGRIAFYTTFNEDQNEDPTLDPHLVAYRAYDDGTLWRFEDDAYKTASGASEAADAGATLILKDMVNTDEEPLFQYSTVDEDGNIDFPAPDSGNLGAILGVRIHLLVDLNPGKSPVHVDFTTLAQLRNQRAY